MLSLQQMLLDYPIALLRAIASVRGVNLSAVTQPEIVAELAVALADPAGIVDAVESCAPETQAVLRQLVAAGGRMNAPAFFRLAGEIRQGGPNWLTREQPWLAPETPAETLWYRGLVGRTFAVVAGDLAEFVFVPLDVLPWLPTGASGQSSMPLQPTNEPSAVHSPGRAFAVDMVSLLALVANEPVTVDSGGLWSRQALHRLNQQLLQPEAEPDIAHVGHSENGKRLSLLLSLAESLAWVRHETGRVRLDAPGVRDWLESTGAQQQRQLWQGWCESTQWNDLLRTPTLRCEGSSWHNDPVGTRQRFVHDLSAAAANVWYAITGVIDAIHAHDPDFQRVDGIYTTWYVRRSDEPNYLLGFEHWHAVEGALITYLLTGPLHWLGAVDLGDPATGVAARAIRISEAGFAWMHDQPPPPAPPVPPMYVADDFRIYLSHDTTAMDRFRVARFASWEASQPEFRYRITQTSLRRAQDTGLTGARLLEFLQRAAHNQLPGNVARALERW